MKHIYLLLILVMVFCLSACSSEETTADKERDAVIVHTEDVLLGNMPIYLHAVGSVKADRTVHIQSRAPGELLEILVQDGDDVHEGQVLFKIDKAPLEVALTSANASLQSNRAQLKKAKDDLARIVQLRKNGFASDDQHEQAQIRVDMFNAALKADEANVHNARLNLSYADIKAPITGKIGSINSDVGNYISPGQPILTTLEDTNSVRIDFAIPESQLIPLRESYKRGNVPVRATTSSGIQVEGLLTFLGNVNTSTGTILVTAKFDNKDNALWIGQFVEVEITLDILENVMIVSEKAVTLGPNGLFVYVINDGKANLRLIESTIEEGGKRVVSRGLNVGDKIVVDGHVRLFDNAMVSIANEEETSSPAQVPSYAPTSLFADEVKELDSPITENIEINSIAPEDNEIIDTVIEIEETTPLQELLPIEEPTLEELPLIQEVEQESEEKVDLHIFNNLDIPKSSEMENLDVFDSQHVNDEIPTFEHPETNGINGTLQEIPANIIEQNIPTQSQDTTEVYSENNPNIESQALMESILANQEAENIEVFEYTDTVEMPTLLEVTEITQEDENTVLAIPSPVESEVNRVLEEKGTSISKPLSGGIDLSTKTILGEQAHLPTTQKPNNVE